MTSPKIFISSTCYDLSYIRENLEKFIKSLGYIPIRSERGSIYFDTSKDVMDSCIDEVPNCQMLVSIIGGCFGSEYKDTGKSITNMEVDKARETKVPIFTLVDNKVLQQYEVWKLNKEKKINYPNVQSTKIFEFIEEVKSASVNNALQPFDTFEDIRSYLLQQWSGMMHHFLTTESQIKRVDETLSTLKKMYESIEIITKQILKDTSKDKVNFVESKLKINEIISEFVLKNSIFRFITRNNIKLTLKEILKNESFEKFLSDKKIELDLSKGSIIMTFKKKEGLISVISGRLTTFRSDFDEAKKCYGDLHEQIISSIKESGFTKESYLSEI